MPTNTAPAARSRAETTESRAATCPRLTREAAAASLWPEADTEAALGNLRVTLGYLHKVLEPDRATGDAPWFVRSEGDVLTLTDEGLSIDAWDLELLLDVLIAVGGYRATSMAINSAGVQLDANMVDFRFPPELR